MSEITETTEELELSPVGEVLLQCIKQVQDAADTIQATNYAMDQDEPDGQKKLLYDATERLERAVDALMVLFKSNMLRHRSSMQKAMQESSLID